MARRRYRNASPQTTLTSGVNGAATSLSVVATTSWPSSTPFTAVVDYGTATVEAVLVTAVVGTTLTVTRGYDGTSGVSHSSGATVQPMALAIDFDEANAHINTGTGVHGLAGALVDTTTAQTLSAKTLTAPVLTGTTTASIITASGAVSGVSLAAVGGVTGASANISGTATAATVAATGNATVGGTLGVTGTSTLGAVAATTLSTSGAATLASGTVAAAASANTDIVNVAAMKAYVDPNNTSYAARAYASGATTTTAATTTDIALATESYDVGSNFAASSYTVPVTGKYHVSFRITGTVANGSEVMASVAVAGTDLTRGSRTFNNTGVASQIASNGADTLDFTAGQVVKLRGYATTAWSVPASVSADTFLSIRKVG